MVSTIPTKLTVAFPTRANIFIVFAGMILPGKLTPASDVSPWDSLAYGWKQGPGSQPAALPVWECYTGQTRQC